MKNNRPGFQVGDEVFCLINGLGIVQNTTNYIEYPVDVLFEKIKRKELYTQKGYLFTDSPEQVLFHKGTIVTFDGNGNMTIDTSNVPPREKPIVRKEPHEFVKGEVVLFQESDDDRYYIGVLFDVCEDKEFPFKITRHSEMFYPLHRKEIIPYAGNEHLLGL